MSVTLMTRFSSCIRTSWCSQLVPPKRTRCSRKRCVQSRAQKHVNTANSRARGCGLQGPERCPSAKLSPHFLFYTGPGTGTWQGADEQHKCACRPQRRFSLYASSKLRQARSLGGVLVVIYSYCFICPLVTLFQN